MVQASAFSEKILCQRHNNALHKLDATAAEVFDALSHFQSDQGNQPDPHGSEFDLRSGEALERWLLKMLWGGTVSGAFTKSGIPTTALRQPAKYQVKLADYLFRGGKLPRDWGMYAVTSGPDKNIFGDTGIAIVPRSLNGELWDGSIAMGAVLLTFAFGSLRQRIPGGKALLRPRAIRFESRLDPAHKVLALGWDHNTETSELVKYTYQRPRRP